MKSLITTAAFSLLALSTIAEAQPQKEQSCVAIHLMASLPTQDAESTTFAFVVLNTQSLMASLPTLDVTNEMPINPMSTAMLIASLPTQDENIEVPTARANATELMASLPTVDETMSLPAARISGSKLMASLPTMDATTVTSVLVDTDIHHFDSKYYHTPIRLTEE